MNKPELIADYKHYLKFWNDQAMINLVAYEQFLKEVHNQVLSPEERQEIYNYEQTRTR